MAGALAGRRAGVMPGGRRIRKVVSGGQTGVDRAALDVARAMGLASGGWCPKGRLAEDAIIDPRYPLKETPTDSYAQRTAWNVRDSDGTLILSRGRPTGGTAQTVEVAKRLRKPCLLIDLAEPPPAAAVRQWAATQGVRVVNVAGPRESKQPGIGAEARRFLRLVFANPPRRPPTPSSAVRPVEPPAPASGRVSLSARRPIRHT